MNQAPSPGVTFRETLSGPFQLGAVDPAEGRREGEAARTHLTLHVAVTIPSVRRFVHDRDQRGEVTGTIDFEPLGRDLVVQRGAFDVSAPTAADRPRVATYELAFERRGTPHFLSARREMHEDASADAAVEASTVLATLHEGIDRTGPIVGAGILVLPADGLAGLVSSVRATGAASMGDRTLTLTAFGRCFLGDLWEAYASPPSPLRRLGSRIAGTFRRGGRR